MMDRYRFDGLARGLFHLVPRDESPPPDGAAPGDVLDLRAALFLPENDFERRRLLVSLGLPDMRPGTLDLADRGRLEDKLVDRIQSAFAVYRVDPPRNHLQIPAPPAPLPPRKKASTRAETWFSLRVVDEVGAPIPGIEVALTLAGDRLVVPTDRGGVVRLDGIEGSSTAAASLVSVAAARSVLAPRWSSPRAPNIPAGPSTFVRELAAAVDALSLQKETPATLVLTPYFQCHEIPGTHFDFGRSFVRSDAIEPLARLAEALSGDDGRQAMIFGHTDLSGPEALNKALSERRAKAIHALFTHDAGAWEELYSGSADGPHWKEKWDLEEAQHMLNALGVTDDAGSALVEDGVRGPSTKQAMRRFQARSYPDCPAEQAPLAPSDNLGVAGRKELFLAYAKRVSRAPADAARFPTIGAARFMGCGEFNPLSLTARDPESRRTVVFLFDPAAAPQGLPCALGSLAPCRASCGPPAAAPDPGGKPPYRCKVYQKVAKKCPCQGGVDLSHDVLVHIPVTLSDAQNMPHVFVLESDDGTIRIEKALSSDARALTDSSCELYFTGLPEAHQYRLSYQADGVTNVLFGFTPYDSLPDVVLPTSLPIDDGPVAEMFARMKAEDDAFAEALAPAPVADGPTREPGESAA